LQEVVITSDYFKRDNVAQKLVVVETIDISVILLHLTERHYIEVFHDQSLSMQGLV